MKLKDTLKKLALGVLVAVGVMGNSVAEAGSGWFGGESDKHSSNKLLQNDFGDKAVGQINISETPEILKEQIKRVNPKNVNDRDLSKMNELAELLDKRLKITAPGSERKHLIEAEDFLENKIYEVKSGNLLPEHSYESSIPKYKKDSSAQIIQKIAKRLRGDKPVLEYSSRMTSTLNPQKMDKSDRKSLLTLAKAILSFAKDAEKKGDHRKSYQAENVVSSMLDKIKASKSYETSKPIKQASWQASVMAQKSSNGYER